MAHKDRLITQHLRELQRLLSRPEASQGHPGGRGGCLQGCMGFLQPQTPALVEKAPRCCPNHHNLSHFVTAEDGYACNSCQVVEGQGAAMFGCRQCDYDLCRACMQKGPPVCPAGHHLVAFVSAEPGYACNACKAVKPKGEEMHGCRPCDYDLCNDCVGKAELAVKEQGKVKAAPVLAPVAEVPAAQCDSAAPVAVASTERLAASASSPAVDRRNSEEAAPGGECSAAIRDPCLRGVLLGDLLDFFEAECGEIVADGANTLSAVCLPTKLRARCEASNSRSDRAREFAPDMTALHTLLLQPMTQPHRRSVAEMWAERRGEKEGFLVEVFVSHHWEQEVGDFMQGVYRYVVQLACEQVGLGAPEEILSKARATSLYIAAFSNNYWALDGDASPDRDVQGGAAGATASCVAGVLTAASTFRIALVLDQGSSALRDPCCLSEVAMAVDAGKSLDVACRHGPVLFGALPQWAAASGTGAADGEAEAWLQRAREAVAELGGCTSEAAAAALKELLCEQVPGAQPPDVLSIVGPDGAAVARVDAQVAEADEGEQVKAFDEGCTERRLPSGFVPCPDGFELRVGDEVFVELEGHEELGPDGAGEACPSSPQHLGQRGTVTGTDELGVGVQVEFPDGQVWSYDPSSLLVRIAALAPERRQLLRAAGG